MKKLILISILVVSLFSNDNQQALWDEVKNSNDIILLKIYLKKYPDGIFSDIAKLKIKRLNPIKNSFNIDNISWWRDDNLPFKYYGIGSAGTWAADPKNVALKRAKSSLEDKLDNLSDEQRDIILNNLQIKEHIDKYGKVYVLVYKEDNL